MVKTEKFLPTKTTYYFTATTNIDISKALMKETMVLDGYDSFDEHEECRHQLDRITDKFEKLSDEHSKLRIAHAELKTSHDALVGAIGHRLDSPALPALPTTVTLDLSAPAIRVPDAYLGLTPENAASRFPKITLWHQNDYKIVKQGKKDSADILQVGKAKPLRGRARMNEGENVTLGFVELENGTIIDGDTAGFIREELRSVYHELKAKGMLPKTWGSIGVTARSFVLSHMYSKFPYLLLCHNDWKVIAIAGPILSQWWNAENKRSKKIIKTENAVEVKVETTIADTRKRDATESPSDDEPVAKRLRSDEVSGDTSALPSTSSLSSTTSAAAAATSESIRAITSVADEAAKSTSPVATVPPSTTAVTNEVSTTLSTAISPSTMTVTNEVPNTSSTTSAADKAPTTVAPSAITPAFAIAPNTALASSAMPSTTVSPSASVTDTAPAAGHVDVESAVSDATPADTTVSMTTTACTAASLSATVAFTSENACTSETMSKTRRRVNPLTKALGAPVGPVKHSESTPQLQSKPTNLRSNQRHAMVAANIHVATPMQKSIESDGLTAAATNASRNPAMISTASIGAGLKKPTQSNAPKNLYYLEYLKEHAAITPAAFETHWKGLPKATQKHWAEISKAKKGEPVSVGSTNAENIEGTIDK
ncbi:hypothetical protein BJ912DRAFT_1092472 [Pholiota molesta]|nr:hypothetical protein BJ912DRAFT_1092472 [Pholiota molesta]